jgi:hypothetical protein
MKQAMHQACLLVERITRLQKLSFVQDMDQIWSVTLLGSFFEVAF